MDQQTKTLLLLGGAAALAFYISANTQPEPFSEDSGLIYDWLSIPGMILGQSTSGITTGFVKSVGIPLLIGGVLLIVFMSKSGAGGSIGYKGFKIGI